MTDQDTMARTIYGEARGEGQAGMIAVANVILNRFSLWEKHPHFGNGTIESVCLAHLAVLVLESERSQSSAHPERDRC